MKILINTLSTKKIAGGAYQIAYNFLVKTLEHPEIDWYYVTSADLDEILVEKIRKSPNYYVFPTQPDFKHSYKQVKSELKKLEERIKPDVVYSITAPSYFTFTAPEVMRFTNPWVTHPNKYSWAALSLKNRLRQKLYCWNQRRMMQKADYFVTQTETTKAGIVRITGVPEKNVCVVKNVLPSVIRTTDNEHIDAIDNKVHIACVGAPVPHKNFDIIPDVLKQLKDRGVDNVVFHVTIPDGDVMLQKINGKMKDYCLDSYCVENHGRVSQQTLAEMYRRCTMCFLPTLLEVFSVSTLEAMFFDLKIVATDFPFNREVMEDSAMYYQPMNASDAAEKIKEVINNKELQKKLSLNMKRQLALYDDYDKHFNDIKDFLVKVGKGEV